MAPKLEIGTLVTRTYLDAKRENRPLSQPLLHATTFTAASAEEHARLYQTNQPTFYQRFGHPNSEAVAEKVAALEEAASALAFSSGMAAISSGILAYIERGSRVVVSAQCFEQTERLFKHLETKFDVEVVFIDTSDFPTAKTVITPQTSFVYLETPSNPHLRISDIRAFSEMARTVNNIPVFVDSTFATPLGQKPLLLGASLVFHSGSKFLGGHQDVMCGFVAGSKEFLAPVREMQVLLGGILDPHAAWLVSRSLKTISVRMERIGKNCLEIAEFLNSSSLLEEVRYPLLQGSSGYEIAKKQMKHGGGIITFRIRGGRLLARTFLDSLELIHIATSLGGIETTIEIPYDLDWFEQVDANRADQEFADPSLIRLSVGIEDVKDLIFDLQNGLEAIAAQGINP